MSTQPLPLRPWTPLRMVLTVCPRCLEEDADRELDYERDILQGNLVAMDGAVYLRRLCQRGHGEVIGLYEEDHRLWEELQRWRIPTRVQVPDRPGNTRPIPMGYLDGLGDLQVQHSCVLLVDVTETCNLECPTCFAASGPGAGRHAPRNEVLRTLDAALAREGGRIDALMLSGGEPTVHPGLLDLVRAATDRKVTRVVINTNGIRIAQDDRFLHELSRLRDRVEVYLQFDGFRASTYQWHRGRDLRDLKDAAVRRLTDARIFTTLAATVARGVNDDEVGAIVDLALDTDYLAGVAVQPMFGSGRSPAFDPMARTTTTGVLARLAGQTGGRVGADDFVALPCSHPDCCAMTYMVRRDDDTYASVVSMIGRERLHEHMAVYGNRLAPDDALWDALTGMLSGSSMVSRPELVDQLLDICELCDLGVSGFVKTLGRWVLHRSDVPVELIARRVKRLSVKSFMDPWTMNVERLQQCCTHVGSTGGDDPVRIPFCARQAFGALRQRTSAGMVPAREVTR